MLAITDAKMCLTCVDITLCVEFNEFATAIGMYLNLWLSFGKDKINSSIIIIIFSEYILIGYKLLIN